MKVSEQTIHHAIGVRVCDVAARALVQHTTRVRVRAPVVAQQSNRCDRAAICPAEIPAPTEGDSSTYGGWARHADRTTKTPRNQVGTVAVRRKSSELVRSRPFGRPITTRCLTLVLRELGHGSAVSSG